MSIQTLQGIWIPQPSDLAAVVNPVFTSFNLTATGHKVAMLVRAPKTGTIHKVGFRTATVATGDTIRVSFQDVDMTTGNPDGGVDQYRSHVIASSDDDAWLTTGILSSDGTDGGTKRSVTKGDLFFVVFDYASYVAGSITIAVINMLGTRAMDHFNYCTTYAPSTWTKNNTAAPHVALEYSDGSYGYLYPGVGFKTMNGMSISSGSTPDEVGMKFTLPFKSRLTGVFIGAIQNVANLDLVLYDSDGSTPLVTVALDSDLTSNSGGRGGGYVCLPSSYVLNKNVAYRCTIKPSTVSGTQWADFEVASAAVMDQMGGGQAFHKTERTDAGAWTDTATKRPFMALCFDGIDVSSGGGSKGILTGGKL